MDDLERHRMARRFNGFPIYDDDEVVAVVNEPEWEWGSLTDDQQSVIRREAIQLQGGRDLTWDDAFAFILGDYGISCPHSWVDRGAWRECKRCRVAEQLPGMVVSVGEQRLRVPDPPPRRLRVPVPPAPPTAITPEAAEVTAELEVDEYEWTGSGYKIASR